MTISISNNGALASLDGIVDRCDVGAPPALLRIYSGTIPANVDTALSGNTLLAQLTMSNPAFGASFDTNPGARANASAITEDATADNTGTATFFRIYQGNGTTAEIQGSVTATGGGGNLEINAVAIVAGAAVQCSSLFLTQSE